MWLLDTEFSLVVGVGTGPSATVNWDIPTIQIVAFQVQASCKFKPLQFTHRSSHHQNNVYEKEDSSFQNTPTNQHLNSNTAC
jgi:hypothetical protein